jgi:CheY-like chemotaxis protein
MLREGAATERSAGDRLPADIDLAGTLHEVSNGLTVILGWLDVARAQIESIDASSSEQTSALEALQIALLRARRAHRIARRAIAAPSPIADDPELLGSIVREAVQGLAPEAERSEIPLVVDLAGPLERAPIEAGDRLLQVLTNLLLNALVATPERGSIGLAVSADPGGAHALLALRDGGPGIPPADRARLFLRGSTGRVGGAGIGLAHARDVVEELGGSLTLAPFAPDRGAEFVIAWPLAAPRRAARPGTAAPADGPVRLEGRRIAVLEDDPAVVELIELSLSARGAEVCSWTAYDALLRCIATDPIDVVLLDASPLGTTGLAVAIAELRARRPGVVVVLISGALDAPVDPSTLGVEWVRKPFDVAELARVVADSTRPA